MFGFKKWRRERLFNKPISDEWQRMLSQNVPYTRKLPAELQEKLRGFTNVFIHEKTFEGCAGLELTDEIKITIAGQACILLLGLEDLSSFYDGLRSVLVYPETYVAKVKDHHNGYVVEEGFQQRHGEAWSRGHVVLAWDEVKKGGANMHDGRNLVFHEFAHLIDYDYGATAEVESGNDSGFWSWGSWGSIIDQEYNKLLRALRRNQRTLIDEYGATNLAEFFAVVTENFFERPTELRQQHPELYNQLAEFYHQEPAKYISS
jgi:Mlc titration factor MtfA (ptsG expression regulator)